MSSDKSPTKLKKVQKNDNRPSTAVNLKRVYKTNPFNHKIAVNSINFTDKYNNNIFNNSKNYENLIKKQEPSSEHFNRHLAQIGENSSGYNAYFNRTNVNALQKAVMP